MVLISTLTAGLIVYFKLNRTINEQNMRFVRNTSDQIKNNVINIQDRYELVADNIVGNSSVRYFLLENYSQPIDYKMFEKYGVINNIFDGARNNYKDIISICVYKENPNLQVDGINIKEIEDFGDEEMLEAARTNPGKYVWGLQERSGQAGKYDIILIKHIDIEKPSGYLVINIREESLLELYGNEAEVENRIYIVDEENRIITSNRRDSVGGQLSLDIAEYLSNSVFPMEIELDNNSYYINQEQINSSWKLVVLHSSTQIETEKRRIEYFIITLSSIFIVFAVLISLYFARRFSSKVNEIGFKIKKVESGKLDISPTIKGDDEFRLLDETLCSMANRIELLTKEILSAVKQKEETEIKFLQMQMNPHFLYNLLSSIKWIAFKNKQNKIIYILEHLINFYKIALSKGNDIITIEAEIDLIKSYVALQNISYDNSINLNIYLDDDLKELKVCKMTLQPFVENSIIHGKLPEGLLNIDVSIEKINEMTVLTISDDGKGFEKETLEYFENLNLAENVKPTENYGIMNTLSRLNLLYKDRVKLFAANNKKGSTVEIVITL